MHALSLYLSSGCRARNSGAVLPLVLVLSALSVSMGIFLLKSAQLESEMAGYNQEFYLLDQSLEQMVQGVLIGIQRNEDCKNEEILLNLSEHQSKCATDTASNIYLSSLSIKLKSKTNLCRINVSAGYEVGNFVDYEFMTNVTASLVGSEQRVASHRQFWTLPGTVETLPIIENPCE